MASKKSMNVVRGLQVPRLIGVQNRPVGEHLSTIPADNRVKSTATITFTGALTSSLWPAQLGLILTNSAGSTETYVPSTSSVSGATFFTFLAGSPAGSGIIYSASGSAEGLHSAITANSVLGLTLANYTAGQTTISLTQNVGGTEGNQTILISGSAPQLSASVSGFASGTNTTTLKASDSGATVLLGGSGAATVNLPLVGASENVFFEFLTVSTDVPAAQHVIQDTEGSLILGCIHHNNGSAFDGLYRVIFNGNSVIRMHASDAAVGDQVRLWCNGTNWYVDGLTNAAVTTS